MKQSYLLDAIHNRLSSFSSEKKVDIDSSTIEEIITNAFTSGPSYYYILNFKDFIIERTSEQIKDILGLNFYPVILQDIIDRIHPEDLNFLIRAEDMAFDMFRNQLGPQNALKYKMSFCTRLKVADGSYHLFLHQAIILSTNEKGHFERALNIHTDISHLTSCNNYKMHLTKLSGAMEFMEVDVYPKQVSIERIPQFSKREKDIIRLIAQGYLSKEIASILFISLNTVKNHRKNIIKKGNARSSSELISKCFVEGVLY